jgi:putative Holliday junction resolvase
MPDAADAGRLLALDYGSRRIGIAVGDLATGLAFSRPALRRQGVEADVAAIAKLASSERAERVVLGLPLHAGGDEGSQAALVRAFGERLADRGLEVAYHDERLTTWEAAQELGPGTARRRTGEVDSTAARLVLQDYLETSRRREEVR